MLCGTNWQKNLWRACNKKELRSSSYFASLDRGNSKLFLFDHQFFGQLSNGRTSLHQFIQSRIHAVRQLTNVRSFLRVDCLVTVNE